MDNIGFEVKLNEQVLCRAGFKDKYYVLSCILDSVSREQDQDKEIRLSIGGLNSVSNQHVKWSASQLNIGDNISIKVISQNFDSPSEIIEQDPEEFLIEQKIKYFYRLKEELKEYLEE
jgi:hypothetical protein